MAKAKPLNAKQLALIDDLFKSKLKESRILKKHGVSRKLYDRWLADENFRRNLQTRKAWEHHHNEIILVKSATQAISNLMDLTKSKQAETARKACLDIITMRSGLSAGTATKPGGNSASASALPNLPPEAAGKLLAVLAQEEPVSTS